MTSYLASTHDVLDVRAAAPERGRRFVLPGSLSSLREATDERLESQPSLRKPLELTT